MLDFIARLTVQGQLLLDAPGLFNRLYQMNWYGGILHEWVDELEISPGGRVLEIGCGPGGLSQYLTIKNVKVTGIDRSANMIKRATAENNSSAVFQQADAFSIPFEDNSFDILIAASLINVVNDKEALIAEMVRLTKVGGKISLIFPTPMFDVEAAGRYANKHGFGLIEKAAINVWAKNARKLDAEIAEQLVISAGLKLSERRSYLDGLLVAVTGAKP